MNDRRQLNLAVIDMKTENATYNQTRVRILLNNPFCMSVSYGF